LSFVEKKKCRPLFRIFIDGVEGSAIADTGASGCIASRKLVKILEENGHVFTMKVASLTYANGKIEKSFVRVVNVDVVLEGVKINTNFMCLDNGEEARTCLGVDFLESANIVMELKRRKWYFAWR